MRVMALEVEARIDVGRYLPILGRRSRCVDMRVITQPLARASARTLRQQPSFLDAHPHAAPGRGETPRELRWHAGVRSVRKIAIPLAPDAFLRKILRPIPAPSGSGPRVVERRGGRGCPGGWPPARGGNLLWGWWLRGWGLWRGLEGGLES